MGLESVNGHEARVEVEVEPAIARRRFACAAGGDQALDFSLEEVREAGQILREGKIRRAIAILFKGSVAGTNRSSPMNQWTRSQGMRLRQASLASN